MTNAEYPTARRDDLVVQETDSEVLVYDLRSNKASCLNSTAALVWNQCDGTKNVDEISKAVSASTESRISTDVVSLALSQLSKSRLLQEQHIFNAGSDRVSRREVIKKIGLSSAVALPVIVTLLAPEAQAQASACNVGATCTCTISGMDAQANPGQACAPAGTGGCSTSGMCTCMATNSGTPVSPGVCAVI